MSPSDCPQCGDVTVSSDTARPELCSDCGDGPVRYSVLLDVWTSPRHPDAVADGPCRISSGDDAVEHFLHAQHRGFIPRQREAFVVILLGARHQPIGLHVAHIGTINTCNVHPREIFRPAIAAGCAAVIVAHNHPSGDCMPSPEDERITDRLQQAGELIGIDVLDHLVLGNVHYYAFADRRVRELPRVQRPQDRPG